MQITIVQLFLSLFRDKMTEAWSIKQLFYSHVASNWGIIIQTQI